MKDELPDSELEIKGRKFNKTTVRTIAAVIVILSVLALITISFSVFQTTPSLGYLVIFYSTIGMVLLGIILIFLLKGTEMLFSAGTIIGSAILIFTVLVLSDNDLTMILGQLISVISFIVNGIMLFYVALKRQ